MELLLDTHVWLWFVNGDPIRTSILQSIGAAQTSNQLYVSAISAWEIGQGVHKSNPHRRPYLQGYSPEAWFRRACTNNGARILQMTVPILHRAATLIPGYGSGDLGDCTLIATAQFRRMSLVTHDRNILRFAEDPANNLSVLPC